MAHGYSFQGYDEKAMARAVGRDIPISAKHSGEIARAIKGKTTARAKKILEGIITLSRPIKYTRFNKDLGHKAGIGAGRYPIKAAEHVLIIINSVEKNAAVKGITNPTILHVAANKAPMQWHHGRKRRRKMKRAHFEIVVGSSKVKDEKKDAKKEAKSESKTESKSAKTAEKKVE